MPRCQPPHRHERSRHQMTGRQSRCSNDRALGYRTGILHGLWVHRSRHSRWKLAICALGYQNRHLGLWVQWICPLRARAACRVSANLPPSRSAIRRATTSPAWACRPSANHPSSKSSIRRPTGSAVCAGGADSGVAGRAKQARGAPGSAIVHSFDPLSSSLPATAMRTSKFG